MLFVLTSTTSKKFTLVYKIIKDYEEDIDIYLDGALDGIFYLGPTSSSGN